MSAALYFEDVREGQELAPFVRTTDLMNWNRFAAVNDEFVGVHMDDEVARKRGDKGVLGMGNLRLSYFHSLLRAWIGDDGEIRRVSIEHRGINYKNDTLTSRGRVTAKRVAGRDHLVDLQLWVENQEGAVLDTGEATVALPASLDQ